MSNTALTVEEIDQLIIALGEKGDEVESTNTLGEVGSDKHQENCKSKFCRGRSGYRPFVDESGNPWVSFWIFINSDVVENLGEMILEEPIKLDALFIQLILLTVEQYSFDETIELITSFEGFRDIEIEYQSSEIERLRALLVGTVLRNCSVVAHNHKTHETTTLLYRKPSDALNIFRGHRGLLQFLGLRLVSDAKAK